VWELIMLRDLFKSHVYVKVYRNKFVVKCLKKNNEIVSYATEPFTTERLLVGDFTNAEKLLKEILKNLYKGSWLAPSPIIMIHPMEMVDGGLSPVEDRVLRELAFGAGGRKVTVWVGNELSDQEVVNKSNNK